MSSSSSSESDTDDSGGGDAVQAYPVVTAKKLRFECEPDVTVVVGRKEFQENSHNLRCWSGFFDAAFRSGMKESSSKRFEFPDKNPHEWELVMSVFHPFKKAQVTRANYAILLPWFAELCSSPGLEECDRVICEMLRGCLRQSKFGLGQDVKSILVTLQRCIEWNRQEPKTKCIELLITFLKDPLPSCAKSEVPRILSFLANQNTGGFEWAEEKELWNAIKVYLPTCVAKVSFNRPGIAFARDEIKAFVDHPLILQEFIELKLTTVPVNDLRSLCRMHAIHNANDRKMVKLSDLYDELKRIKLLEDFLYCTDEL